MLKKNSFKYEELIDCANGKLFGPGNAKLPSPPMLMFHRITNVDENKVAAILTRMAMNGDDLKDLEALENELRTMGTN